jgi:hypothetical protein
MFDALVHFDISTMISNMFHLKVSSQVVVMCALLSAAGAVILAKLTGSFGNLTYPLNFSVLLAGTVLANSLFAGIDIPSFQQQQEAVVYAVGGLVSASFAMLWFTGIDA